MIGTSSAYLLWAVTSSFFFVFLLVHLWLYDRFKCVRWNSGRQPGAFKRVMTYCYLGSVPMLVFFSVATTAIKFQEGFILVPTGHIIPKPIVLWPLVHRRWVLPLNFVFSMAWALEMVTHLEELTFWLYLLHQGPDKRQWFHCWEYRTWYIGSIIAILGMPLTAMISRHNLETSLAWIFLVGSSASTATTLCFLYIIGRFPIFLRSVKAEGADPGVVMRLTTFYHLNLVRVLFRFIYTVPLFILSFDALRGLHIIIRSLFWTDFFIMLASIGCLVSSAITLLIFFPRWDDTSRQPDHTPKVVYEKPTEFVPHASEGCCRRYASSTPKFPTNSRPPSIGSAQSSHLPFSASNDDFETNVAQEHHHDPHPILPSGGDAPPMLPYPEETYTFNQLESTPVPPKHPTDTFQESSLQAPPNLHPYVVSFTSPIDLHDGSADISHAPRSTV